MSFKPTFLLLVACVLIGITVSAPTSRVVLTNQAIKELEHSVGPLLLRYLNSLEPLALPDIVKTVGSLVKVNISSVRLNNFLFNVKNTSLSVSKLRALHIQIRGITADMAFDYSYYESFPKIHTQGTGTAGVSGVTFEIDLRTTLGSHGQPVITTSRTAVDIDALDIHLTGADAKTIDFFLNIMNPYIIETLQLFMPNTIASLVASDTAALFAKNSTLILPTPYLNLNISLADDVVTTDQAATLDFNIDVFTGSVFNPLRCPYAKPIEQLPTVDSDSMIQLSVHQQVVDCVVWATYNTGTLSSLVQSALAPLLNEKILHLMTFTQSSQMEIAVKSAPSINVQPDGINLNMNLGLTLVNTKSDGKQSKVADVDAKISGEIVLVVSIQQVHVSVRNVQWDLTVQDFDQSAVIVKKAQVHAFSPLLDVVSFSLVPQAVDHVILGIPQSLYGLQLKNTLIRQFHHSILATTDFLFNSSAVVINTVQQSSPTTDLSNLQDNFQLPLWAKLVLGVTTVALIILMMGGWGKLKQMTNQRRHGSVQFQRLSQDQ